MLFVLTCLAQISICLQKINVNCIYACMIVFIILFMFVVVLFASAFMQKENEISKRK